MDKIIYICTFLTAFISSYAIEITLIPIYGHSHAKAAAVFGQELSRRGHNVTLIQFNSSIVWENITTRNISTIFPKDYRSLYKFEAELSPFEAMTKSFHDLVTHIEEYHHLCHEIINDSISMSILKRTDLVIGEITLKCPVYIARYFKKPLVGYTHLGTEFLNSVHRNSVSDISVPSIFMLHTDKMSIGQKMTQLFGNYIAIPLMDYMYKHYFKDLRGILGLEDSMDDDYHDLVILQYDPILEYPQPMESYMFPVGAWTMEPAQTLPVMIEEFISTSDRGFIFVNFGTIYDISGDDLHSLLIYLSHLPYYVIFKGKRRNSNKSSFPNIMLVEDAPQNDILAHPNIKLFITHAGILSCRETCYHGVPILAVPRGIDQKQNAFRLVERVKIGIAIEFNTQNFKTWPTLISEIIQNNVYKENAMRCSQIMKSEPHTYARQRAADIVERFIRWDYNASHLRPHILDMAWYEYYWLDILSTVFIIPILVVVLLIKCFKVATYGTRIDPE